MRSITSVFLLGLLLVGAACGGGGTSGAEESARRLYEQSRTLNGLESNLDDVSCAESATPEPDAHITLYDCTLRFETGDTALWCVVDGSARTAPLPVPCSTIPREYLTSGA